MSKNILVIFNDDHGQWALPAYGNSELRTPTLDYLASNGVVMENAFTPIPVCSPARACFLTGLLPSQHGLHDYIASGDTFGTRRWLDDEKTLPQLLNEAGYHVGLSGKWHLGDDMNPHPGFDDWFALSGDYPIDHKGKYRYSDNGQEMFDNGYKSQLITDHALRFLSRRDRDKPFFLFVGYTATHSPWADHPPRLVEQYKDASFRDVPDDSQFPFGVQNLESKDLRPAGDMREGLQQYYAAVSNLDESTGRLVDILDTEGLLDDTLIVYTSDHGLCCGHHGIWGKGNGTLPLNMVEESIRIPMIFHQPSSLPAGRRQEFADHLDLFQTLVAHAGISLPDGQADKYPGRSLMPSLTNQTADEAWRQAQYCEYGTVRMIRTTRYKLLRRYGEDRCELFDLIDDPREQNDLSGEAGHRERVDALSRDLEMYFKKHDVPEKSGLRPDGPAPTNRTSPWVEQPG